MLVELQTARFHKRACGRRGRAFAMAFAKLPLFCMFLLPLLLAGSQEVLGISPYDETAGLLEFLKGAEPRPGGCVVRTWAGGGGGCPASFCGVACEGDAVVTLDLSGQGLRGTFLSHTIAILHSLASLNLSNNSLSGELPSDLGSFLSLEALDLSLNFFTGSIPKSLSSLHRLLYLNISSNRLTGSLPFELSSLVSLRTIDLHNNQLSGVLDPALLQLSSLTAVDLSNNQLSGFIPWQSNDTLPLLQTVEHVNLSHNQLSGPLAPAKLESIFAEKLKVLDMSHNQLFGNLPDFEFVIALVSLRLNNNFFTGSVPSILLSAGLGLLEELDLSHNNLTGEIPRVLSTSLKTLNISSNFLSGTLPQKLGSCSVVDLNHNQLSGDLFVWQYWSEMLEVLDISSNDLTGNLLEDISKFVRLRNLQMSHNQLSGSIPSSYGFLPKLSVIDLSFNKLSGFVPASFFNSSTLSALMLSNNMLTGSFPPQDVSFSSGGFASQIVVMDLANNGLNGTMSDGITNFQKLQKLNLSSNVLSGRIPFGLCNLSMLQMLDLSDNFFTGPIPAVLPKPLVVLQLANNNLSGPIPENLKHFTSTSFFPGNEGLFLPSPFSTGQNSPLKSSHLLHTTFGAALRAELISGFLAGIVFLALVGLIVYYKFMHKPKENSNHNEKHLKTSKKTKDNIQMQKMWSSRACSAFRHDPVPDPSLSVRFSDDLLLENESKYRELDRGLVLNMKSPCKSRATIELASASQHGNVSCAQNEPQKVEELSFPPEIVKVQSPDKLAGDLHFLDKSMHFTAEELSQAPAEVLGRSSHGTSYKATLDNGHILTVKWLREGLARNKRDFSREAKKFAKVRHPNLTFLRAYYWGPGEHEKLILSDFVSSRSLASHLNGRTVRGYSSLSWRQRLNVAIDIARGLSYLHNERHLSHGNLKATNVLIDQGTFSAFLADYSLHQLMTSEGTANQILNAGALGYRAPELALMKKPKPSFQADVYAFGVLMLELLTGQGAGDIISGQSGAVDLTDWVKLLAQEVRTSDCFDPMLVSVGGTQGPPPGVEEVLVLALKCISQQPNERPAIQDVYEELTSISVS